MVCRPRYWTIGLFLVFEFVAALLCVYAASAETPRPADRIDQKTLPGVTLYRSAHTNLVRSLYGSISFYGVEGSAEQIARLFLGQNAALFGLSSDPKELVLASNGGSIETGYILHFSQYYRGIPVEGHEVVVRIDSRNMIKSVASTVVPISGLCTTPGINQTQATDLAKRALWDRSNPDRPWEDPRIMGVPHLKIRAEEGKTAQFVWEVTMQASNPPGVWIIALEATSGTLSSVDTPYIGPRG